MVCYATFLAGLSVDAAAGLCFLFSPLDGASAPVVDDDLWDGELEEEGEGLDLADGDLETPDRLPLLLLLPASLNVEVSLDFSNNNYKITEKIEIHTLNKY